MLRSAPTFPRPQPGTARSLVSCVYVNTHAHIHTHKHTHTYARARTRAYVYTHTHTNTHTHLLFQLACTATKASRIHYHMYVCVYIHTYIHTYHTCSFSWPSLRLIPAGFTSSASFPPFTPTFPPPPRPLRFCATACMPLSCCSARGAWADGTGAATGAAATEAAACARRDCAWRWRARCSSRASWVRDGHTRYGQKSPICVAKEPYL